MQIFGGGEEFAKKKDIISPNLIAGSKDFTGSKWVNIQENVQKDKYLDFTAIHVNWGWDGISQYIAVNKGETFTASMYVKVPAGSSVSWYIALLFNEANYKLVNVDQNMKTINGTGNWQKTSITFTVTGDSGAIRPRIESDGSSQFWIAGMKLERGTNATPWCPAPEDYAMKADLLKYLLNGQSQTRVDDSFDLNSADIGTYRSWGKKPKNAPNDAEAWCLYMVGCFGDSAGNKYEIALDTDGTIYCRTLAGNPSKWNTWKKITTTDVK